MTDARLTRSGDELVVEIPPAGVRRGAFSIHAAVGVHLFYALLALAVAIVVGVALLSGGGGIGPGGAVLGAAALAFLGVATWRLAQAYGHATAHRTIRVTPTELTLVTAGRGGERERRWPRDDIDLIRVRRRQLAVNGIVVPELELFAGDAGVVIAGGASRVVLPAGRREEEELQRIGAALGAQLGIQTDDAWRPGSPEHRPIPAPRKTDIHLDDGGRGRLRVEIPVAGKLSRLVSTLLGLGILAAIATMVVAHELGVPAHWSLRHVPATHVAAFAIGVPGLWVLRRFLVPRLAAQIVIDVADGALSVTTPGAFGARTRSWQADAIERVGLDYLMSSTATEGMGYLPVLRIVVLTEDGPEEIVGVDAPREYELHWVADRMQRTLAGGG